MERQVSLSGTPRITDQLLNSLRGISTFPSEAATLIYRNLSHESRLKELMVTVFQFNKFLMKLCNNRTEEFELVNVASANEGGRMKMLGQKLAKDLKLLSKQRIEIEFGFKKLCCI